MLNVKNDTAMGRTRVTGKVEPIVKKWLSKDEAKSYIGCSDDFFENVTRKSTNFLFSIWKNDLVRFIEYR